ncbi:hypothetical protein C0J52_03945 [Blattella germanica]|nr:hypothetical protein C0J52_03945 [Blattella germanica]
MSIATFMLLMTRLRTLLQVKLTCTIRIHALCLQTSGEEKGEVCYLTTTDRLIIY